MSVILKDAEAVVLSYGRDEFAAFLNGIITRYTGIADVVATVKPRPGTGEAFVVVLRELEAEELAVLADSGLDAGSGDELADEVLMRSFGAGFTVSGSERIALELPVADYIRLAVYDKAGERQVRKEGNYDTSRFHDLIQRRNRASGGSKTLRLQPAGHRRERIPV